MKYKYFYLLVPWIIMTMLLTGCSDSSPIIIGFSGQLTGKNSDLGVYGRNGATLAIEHLNNSGGIHGHRLQLLAKDDENTPEGALRADKELIKAGAIAIVGHMTSSQTMAAIPFINKNRIVMVSPTTATPELTGIRDSFFRVFVDNTILSQKLAEYAHSSLDINTALTLSDSDNQSFSAPFIQKFIHIFEKAGGIILDQLTYSSSNSTNWDIVIDSLINTRSEAIILSCPAQDIISLAQRIRAAGLKTQIISSSWGFTDKLLHWGGQAVEETICATAFAADNPRPEFVNFLESYKNRFGNNPNFASAFSYEAILTIAAALQQTNGSATGLADAIANNGIISGVMGDFRLDEYGDVKRNIFIVTIQDSQFRTMEMK